MNKLLGFLNGKKTYLVAITAAVLAFCNAMGIVIPDFVMQILVALGLATLRAAVK